MQKLLIADPSEEYCMALEEALHGAYIVRSCHDGREAQGMLQTFKPNILVLDLMMPGVDGIGLLQEAGKLEQRPAVLAVTRYISNFVMERLSQLGVGYVMLKSCELQMIIARIGDMTQQMEPPLVTRPDSRTTATNILLSLGISTKLRGYGCVREAVMLMMQDPCQSVTKELYPAVAKICGGNALQVERAIRCAIQGAWDRRDERVWRMYFPTGPDGHIPRPTNAAFISRLADRIVMSTDAVI